MMTVTVIPWNEMPSPGGRRVQGKKDVPARRGRAGQVRRMYDTGSALPRTGDAGQARRGAPERKGKEHSLLPTLLTRWLLLLQ
jgi:hypothetical protein